MIQVAIIGGGAAGCFAAVNIKKLRPDVDVTVYESGRRPLAKVAITGGGRCNLTNSFADVLSLESIYPRGSRLMKRLLKVFSHVDTMKWFEGNGVRLVTQPDHCVFPASQDAMEIVGTLTSGMRRAGVNVLTGHRVAEIVSESGDASGYTLKFIDDALPDVHADKVLVTTGGSPRRSGLSMLDGLGLDIIDPVPSLFSFNIGMMEKASGSISSSRDEALSSLMGTVVNNAVIGLVGTRFRASGPLLITDWGMSGPAILKLSSYAARFLAENQYRASLSVNWLGEMNVNEVVSMLSSMALSSPQKQLASLYPDRFNSRLWAFLIGRAGLPSTKRWAELGQKGMNRLADTLTCDIYPVVGRNRFKGEFVTCGGVALTCIDPNTLECRRRPGLYFAGEVMDVDAVTGGFNLQAAWTMGYVAARAISVAIPPSRP